MTRVYANNWYTSSWWTKPWHLTQVDDSSAVHHQPLPRCNFLGFPSRLGSSFNFGFGVDGS